MKKDIKQAWRAYGRALPYLAGPDGPGRCTNCGHYSAVRYRLHVPACHRGALGSLVHQVCGECLSLTPHRPLF